MKLTIIETGLPPDPLRADWPTYPVMFERLISKVDQDFVFETCSIVTGDAFPKPNVLEGVIITGSAYGVYDDVPWMPQLFDFIRGMAAAQVPQFGICFGHQAMAEALGGKAGKSEKGWGLGRHEYQTPHRPGWMTSGPDTFTLAVSHQDQVTAIPDGTKITARSDFCEYAGLAYSGSPSASFQGHPEFDAGFGAALHESRRDRIGDALVDAALDSFAKPLDRLVVARWMADFFRHFAKA